MILDNLGEWILNLVMGLVIDLDEKNFSFLSPLCSYNESLKRWLGLLDVNRIPGSWSVLMIELGMCFVSFS